jgi:hypothetical protein
MRSAAKSTAQISLASVAGVAAGTAVTAFTASVAAPVIVGGLAAVGVGYGFGKLVDWISG